MKTLTTGEIASICDVNLRTVIRWIERGELKGFKLPGRGNNRVTQEDFVAFLKKHKMPIPAELLDDGHNHILIVDDELPFSKSIQRVLRGAGYETSIANDGFAAGSQLSALKPALMTLDLSMPGLDGFDVIRFVRHSAIISSTRILVVSALNEQELSKALECGADAYLQKPFANSELLASVEMLMGCDRSLVSKSS